MKNDFSHISESRKMARVWGVWKKEADKGGRLTKVTYSVKYSGRASSTNSNTWGTFAEAMNLYKNQPETYSGIAIFMSNENNLVFIDVDHCIDKEGNLSTLGRDIVNHFQDTYIEKSQSGEGLHILALGDIPKNNKNSSNGIELYKQARFCALTGDILTDRDIASAQEGISYVWDTYRRKDSQEQTTPRPSYSVNLEDKDIIERASRSKNGSKFEALYKTADGWKNLFSSHSEADQSLCNILAFWCNRDKDTIDRLFRSSALYRTKWERRDYRERTLTASINGCRECLSEFVERRRKEKLQPHGQYFRL